MELLCTWEAAVHCAGEYKIQMELEDSMENNVTFLINIFYIMTC